jgi:hypothetical protein
MRDRQQSFDAGLRMAPLAGTAPNAVQTECGFARLGVRHGGRAFRLLQRRLNAERTGLLGEIGATTPSRNCALDKRGCEQRDSRRDGASFQCAAIHAPRSVIASAAPAVPFLPDGRRHLFSRSFLPLRPTRRRVSIPSRGRGGTFFAIPLGRLQLGGDATQDGANAFPSVRLIVGLERHVQKHDARIVQCPVSRSTEFSGQFLPDFLGHA